MKCFICFFLVVLASLVSSSPAIGKAAHDHRSVQGQSHHEGIHQVEQPAEVEVANDTKQIVSPSPNDTNAIQNITLVASLYSNASVQELPDAVEVNLNGSDNELGHSMENHENCSHCLNEINENGTKELGCMCALFTAQHPIENEAPLLPTTTHNVSCHESASGQEACDKICIAVAEAHADLEDYNICPKILNATKMSVFLQSKICGNGTNWNYTGLSSKAPLCCYNGLVIQCQY